METLKLTEAEQRRAVLHFIESRLKAYGDVKGEKGSPATIAGHATFYLGVRDGSGRGVVVAFQILKGIDENGDLQTQVEIENQKDFESLKGGIFLPSPITMRLQPEGFRTKGDRRAEGILAEDPEYFDEIPDPRDA